MHSNLQTFADLGELIGGIAVVVSLVYLALQVRQNTLSLRTENYSRALDRIASIQAQLSRDGELSGLFAAGIIDVTRLTPRQRIQLTWGLYETFGAFEFMFHASRTRALPEEVWVRWSATVAWWLTFPGAQTWWRNRPAPFSASFTAFVEDILRDNPADRDAMARWQTFVAHGEARDESSPPAA